MKKTGFFLWLALIILVFMLFGCQPKNNGQNQPVVIPVKIEEAVVKEISIPIRTSGRLVPKTQIKLSFKTGGIIEKISADEGDSVIKGQVLASLNLAEIRAGFNNARNGFLKTKRDLERVTNLYRDRAATLEQHQNAETACEIARSNMEIARFNLDHSVIRAPFRGKILKRLVEVNEVISSGYPVFIFGSTENQWVVKAGVSARDAVLIEMNDPARVRFDAYPAEIFSARITEISQAVDPASGTIEVELGIRDKGLTLMSGFVAQVDVVPEKKNRYTLIPVDALVDSEGSTAYVFIPLKNRARKIKIRIVHLFRDKVAVDPGSESLGRVITDGAAYLTDGMAIKIVD